ncbi:INO80 complex subunit B isoform X1 [Scyliorhinus torazame]|uniref:INO80 complex subunit B isoform X1 n=1 Tax=Scyliorhinus torazame TaxID=75743 RepID=UPI003B58D316
MGKKKEAAVERGLEDEAGGHSSHKKKHKKHKKHKKKHHQADVGLGFSSETLESDSGTGKPQLKLKIKLGGQTMGTKSVPHFSLTSELKQSPSPLTVDDEPDEVPLDQYRAWLGQELSITFADEESNLDPSPLPDLDSETLQVPEQDEEQRWLDALEKGELDDNGELKKEINESLLTARQRALLHKQQSQPLLELPMGYKAKEMTEEMMVKRAERARKRRLQAAKKAEDSKNQTIERLTKTNKAKVKTLRERRTKRVHYPMIRYSNNAIGITVSFPHGCAVPLPAISQPVPTPVTCGIEGCSNFKKYSCSKTGLPLCSFECYKKNLLIRSLA